MFHFGKLKRAIVSAFHTIPLRPLPEDGSSCRKRWIVSFSQGGPATLPCFTEQNTWQRTSILLHSHPVFFGVSLIHQSNGQLQLQTWERNKQIPTISFKKKTYSFPKNSQLIILPKNPSHQGSRSMTCSNTTKPCPLVVELNQPTPLKNMRSRQIGWTFPFRWIFLKKLKPPPSFAKELCSRL